MDIYAKNNVGLPINGAFPTKEKLDKAESVLKVLQKQKDKFWYNKRLNTRQK